MGRENKFRFEPIELCENFQEEVRNSVLGFRKKVKDRVVYCTKVKNKSDCAMNP